MKPHNLNQVAVWLPMNRDGLDMKVYDEYKFMEKGIIQMASSFSPVVRYVKNYYRDNNKFSLCIISKERNSEAMESFLDKVAEDINLDKVGAKFALTDIFYKA